MPSSMGLASNWFDGTEAVDLTIRLLLAALAPKFGGDLHGAAWVKDYDGSSTNNAEITVPDNISTLISNGYGISFAGANDYVAIGVRDWQSFQQ